VTVTQNKKTRNQLAGYITHLYKLVQAGRGKGLYIPSHEKEKERRESFIPKIGVLDVEKVTVDHVTFNMIKEYSIQGKYVSSGSEVRN